MPSKAPPMSARGVAEYFLAKVDEDAGDGLSNLKVQKLVYYAQAYYLALHRRPLFSERIEAWAHGPVIPDLYHEFKRFGAGSIACSDTDYPDDINKDDSEYLDEVYNVFGQYSAWKLRDMTHAEPPWKDAYVEAPSSVITHEAMIDYFKDYIEE